MTASVRPQTGVASSSATSTNRHMRIDHPHLLRGPAAGLEERRRGDEECQASGPARWRHSGGSASTGSSCPAAHPRGSSSPSSRSRRRPRGPGTCRPCRRCPDVRSVARAPPGSPPPGRCTARRRSRRRRDRQMLGRRRRCHVVHRAAWRPPRRRRSASSRERGPLPVCASAATEPRSGQDTGRCRRHCGSAVFGCVVSKAALVEGLRR